MTPYKDPEKQRAHRRSDKQKAKTRDRVRRHRERSKKERWNKLKAGKALDSLSLDSEREGW